MHASAAIPSFRGQRNGVFSESPNSYVAVTLNPSSTAAHVTLLPKDPRGRDTALDRAPPLEAPPDPTPRRVPCSVLRGLQLEARAMLYLLSTLFALKEEYTQSNAHVGRAQSIFPE